MPRYESKRNDYKSDRSKPGCLGKATALVIGGTLAVGISCGALNVLQQFSRESGDDADSQPTATLVVPADATATALIPTDAAIIPATPEPTTTPVPSPTPRPTYIAELPVSDFETRIHQEIIRTQRQEALKDVVIDSHLIFDLSNQGYFDETARALCGLSNFTPETRANCEQGYREAYKSETHVFAQGVISVCSDIRDVRTIVDPHDPTKVILRVDASPAGDCTRPEATLDERVNILSEQFRIEVKEGFFGSGKSDLINFSAAPQTLTAFKEDMYRTACQSKVYRQSDEAVTARHMETLTAWIDAQYAILEAQTEAYRQQGYDITEKPITVIPQVLLTPKGNNLCAE